MARMALIKDGRVVNVILADKDHVRPGHTMVESPTASVGELFDGRSFSRLKPDKTALLQHVTMRHSDTMWTRHELPNGRSVTVDTADREALRRFADRASRDPAMTLSWPQHRDGTTVLLSPKDIVDLNNAVTDHMLNQHRAFAGVLDGIASGKITTHDQIDFPPAPLPQWPIRNDEKR